MVYGGGVRDRYVLNHGAGVLGGGGSTVHLHQALLLDVGDVGVGEARVVLRAATHHHGGGDEEHRKEG